MIHYLSRTSPKNLRGTVLLRLDFNTEDEWRMETTLPTIRLLLKRGLRVVIVSHRGRPSGFERKLSLKKDAKNLEKLLGQSVTFIPHFRFSEMKRKIAAAPSGSVFLLENIRFLPGEEPDDPGLARQLASLADFYVNDAFAVSHRDDASLDAITRFLPSYAGLELESEIKHLSHVMGQPKKPLVVILGGGKAHDKLPVIRYFRKRADTFLLGGAVANAVLREKGFDIKKSKAEERPGKTVREVARYRNIVLPVDYAWKKATILDTGKESNKLFARKIKSARTIIWNGPVGLIEKKKFAHGTEAVIRAIGRNKRAFCLAGGGETVMFIKENKFDRYFNFISTGGGAMLEFLSGKKLPGIEALKRPWPGKKR